jgi:hypothetical protein
MIYTGPRNGVTQSWCGCAGFECPDCGGHGHCRDQARRAPAFPMQRLPQACFAAMRGIAGLAVVAFPALELAVLTTLDDFFTAIGRVP